MYELSIVSPELRYHCPAGAAVESVSPLWFAVILITSLTAIKDGVLGTVMTIHTFGDYSRIWHPHLHAMVADGLFYGNGLFYVRAHSKIN